MPKLQPDHTITAVASAAYRGEVAAMWAVFFVILLIVLFIRH